MRVRMAVAGLMAIVAAVVGAVAVAGGDERRGLQTFSYTTGATTVASGDQDVARANCGSNGVVGGGIAVTPAGRGSEVASSDPGDDASDSDEIPNNLWEAWANRQGGAPAAELISHVVCEGGGVNLDLAYEEREFSIPNNKTRTARRACPASHPLVSGGIYLSGSGVGAEVASMGPYDGSDGDRRPDDGCRASASSDREGAQNATVFAICSGNSEVRYTKRTKRLPRRGRAVATVGCPGISSATGGGAIVSKPTRRIELFASRPHDNDDPDSGPSNGWSGGAVNREREKRRLTVAAICVVP